MPRNERPLSPHLTVYKIELPMLLSGLSRVSGVALSVGSILLVAWIASAVHSAEVFSVMSSFLGSFIGQVLLFGWTFSLIYHSINGIRHLIWDTGNMLEVEQIYASSKVVAVLTPIITITVWLLGGGFPGGGA